MKKSKIIFTSILVTAVLILQSCGIDTTAADAVRTAAEATNSLDSYEARFKLDMQLISENVTILFAQGSYTAEKTGSGSKVEASMSQTVLGVSSSVKALYENNIYKTITDENENEQTMSEEEFYSQIVYSKTLIFDNEKIKNIKESPTNGGTIYELELKDADEELKKYLGDDIYSFAQILTPRKDKTSFRDIKITYTVKEKDDVPYVVNFSIVFTVSLYETPPYNPAGQTIKDSDYMLEIKVSSSTDIVKY